MQQNTAILIVVTALLVVGGGAFVWWFFATPSSEVEPSQELPTQLIQTGGSVSTQNPSTPTTPSTQTSSTQATTDIAKAYYALFPKILATPVMFVEATASSTGELKALYSLYASHLAVQEEMYPGSGPFALDVALVDLTNDGVPEAIVYESIPSFCGSAGCMLEVYAKISGTWSKVFSTVGAGEVGLSNTLVNGHLDLYLSVEDKNTVDRYTWSGSTYVFKEVMATWDGEAFVPR